MLAFNFEPFPTLETNRLLLRRVTLDDTEEIFFFRSDEAVMKHIGRAPAVSKQEAIDHITQVDEMITANDAIRWGITLKGAEKLIGTIGFWNVQKENFRAEVGYMLHPYYQQQGLMKEALQRVLAFAFITMNLHSIEANISVENIASQKLLEATGFIREAYFRENHFFEGRFLDSAVYSLLANYFNQDNYRENFIS